MESTISQFYIVQVLQTKSLKISHQTFKVAVFSDSSRTTTMLQQISKLSEFGLSQRHQIRQHRTLEVLT